MSTPIPADPDETAPNWAADPDAPYFETMYAAAQILRPGITREETLATLRESDPEDTLRVREPRGPEDDESGGERWADWRCTVCGHYPPCQCPGNPFGTAPPAPPRP